MRFPTLIAALAALLRGDSADAFSAPSRHRSAAIAPSVRSATFSAPLAGGRPRRPGSAALFSSAASIEDAAAGDGDDLPLPPGHDCGLLLTWDLDDTLYPLTSIIGRANIAFSMCMSKLGYRDVHPRDINRTVKQIRQEMLEDPELYPPTYAQLRTKAIRREMVRYLTDQNLKAVAVDEGTDVSKLTAPILQLAERKAQTSLDNSAVQAVYDAWEKERHSAADANVYPDVLPMLQKLRAGYPYVVMGAVTNGAANPLKMPNTLAPYFDFCVCWGDDGIARKPDGAIYEAALERYKRFARGGKPMRCWIHIGDDLAYDVGGSAAVGAKTIWTDLEEDYGQTAGGRLKDFRTAPESVPVWSTAPEDELEMRAGLAEESRDKVTETVHTMSEIPMAVQRILRNVLED